MLWRQSRGAWNSGLAAYQADGSICRESPLIAKSTPTMSPGGEGYCLPLLPPGEGGGYRGLAPLLGQGAGPLRGTGAAPQSGGHWERRATFARADPRVARGIPLALRRTQCTL